MTLNSTQNVEFCQRVFLTIVGMAKAPSTLFGARLRAARLRVGIPQDRLGTLIGLDEACSSARISRYESGAHAPPFRTAEQIAAALGVPVAYFYCPDDTLAEVLLLVNHLVPSERERLLAFVREFVAS